MPSDVHIQHSAHLQRAQPKLIVHSNDSGLSNDIGEGSQSIYIQRYKALREAGFDDLTANKYSSMYSSVNQVIDAILSQSLADHLVVEGDLLKSNQTNNGFSNKSAEGILSNGQHASTDFNRASSQDTTNLSSLFAENPSPGCESFAFTSEPNSKQSGSSLNEQSELIASSVNIQGKTHCDHLNDNDHCDELDKTRSDLGKGIDCLNDNSFDPNRVVDFEGRTGNSNKCNNYGQGMDEGNGRLSELFGINLFPASMHDISGIDQFKSDPKAELPSNDDTFMDKFKSILSSDDFGGTNHYFDEDLSFANGTFNSNLLVTVLKDGIFDSDEVILEDEGMVEPNVTSSSPSASSSLSSSGASSLLLDSSSSPSSFSSLSSSISITPPNAPNGFESSPIESGFVDSLFGFHYNSKQLDNISLNGAFSNSKSKFGSFAGNNDQIESNDLTRENVNKLATLDGSKSGNMNNSTGHCPASENSVLSSLNKSFFGYNNESCPLETIFSTKNSSPSQNGNFAYNELSGTYPSESILSQFGSLQASGNSDLLENNFTSQAPNNYVDNFGKYLSQPSDVSSIRDSSFNGKNFPNDDSPDLLGYLNGRQMRQNSLFDYDQSNRSTDPFGFSLDKMNKSAFDSKNDLFGDFHFGLKGNFNSFMEDSSLFNSSHDSDLLCGNSQSQYSNGYLNQRTFADIAASNVISGGLKSNGECLGAMAECKSPKPGQMNCSNLNMSNLNSTNGYFNLFASNGNNGSGQNPAFFDQNCHGFAKKSFCSQPNYRSSLSPMGNKFSNGQLMNESVNFSSQVIRSNMPISPMMSNANMGEMGNDGSMNKPTNLMAYKGLWVCNISPEVTLAYLKRRFRRFGHFTGIQTFERRATNGSNIVFVHYDNPYSPIEAISCLHNYTGQDLCADQNEPLKLRFAPSMEQSRAGQLPTLEQARKMVERHGECFNWRLSSGCHRGMRCQLKHVPINKEIDSQPWVKALKKKNNDL